MVMPVLTEVAQMQTEVRMEIMQRQEETVAGQATILTIAITAEM